MLDYRQLEALAAVADEGGFEKAGRKLCLTQSAVTQRIRQLEEQTGQILLIRSHPPRITPAGRGLLEHYRKVSLLENELSGRSDTGTGSLPVLPVAVNADSLATWFSPVIEEYMKQERGFLDIRTADQDVTRHLLTDGTVMGCVSASEDAVRGCRRYPLGRMIYRFVCAPSLAERYFPEGLTLEGLRRAPLLNFNRDDRLLAQLTARLFPRETGEFRSHYVPSPEQFLVLIARGCACGLMPECQYRDLPSGRNLVDLSEEASPAVSLYWHRWSLESEELDRLTRMIISRAGESLEDMV